MEKAEYVREKRKRLIEEARDAKLGNVVGILGRGFKGCDDIVGRLAIERSTEAADDLINWAETLRELAQIAREKIEALPAVPEMPAEPSKQHLKSSLFPNRRTGRIAKHPPSARPRGF